MTGRRRQPVSRLSHVRPFLRVQVWRSLTPRIPAVESHAPPYHERRAHLAMITSSLDPTLTPDLLVYPHRTPPIDRQRRLPAPPDKLPQPSRWRLVALSSCFALTPAGQLFRPHQNGTEMSQTSRQRANGRALSEAPLVGPLVSGQFGSLPAGLTRGGGDIDPLATRDCLDSRSGCASWSVWGGRHAE